VWPFGLWALVNGTKGFFAAKLFDIFNLEEFNDLRKKYV
jgi:hypothetical protein